MIPLVAFVPARSDGEECRSFEVEERRRSHVMKPLDKQEVQKVMFEPRLIAKWEKLREFSIALQDVYHEETLVIEGIEHRAWRGTSSAMLKRKQNALSAPDVLNLLTHIKRPHAPLPVGPASLEGERIEDEGYARIATKPRILKYIEDCHKMASVTVPEKRPGYEPPALIPDDIEHELEGEIPS